MSLFELLDPKAEDTTILLNAGKYRPVDKAHSTASSLLPCTRILPALNPVSIKHIVK